ncbi:beta-1,3-galactosyl-O-glycosyl-glycoprotein beta-1,6-N-acetylglucosaminyltransferase 3-like [Haliotis rufescens]|uniref:beta-1,3-galactosyl-O-glycosyl-glycoprotein beta-1,6-N-acetylglucosaminyltransferase 3-like n=1 Tax=Haliotis rufescens TaxID=6454 RepID=UPI00201F9567|nr:beta-1,3-galactosyl-O-glycosyl-glycoprotein beta-1,6-N-acetylglucosaminyltransferase 3-like [Haliotis rufescens]
MSLSRHCVLSVYVVLGLLVIALQLRWMTLTSLNKSKLKQLLGEFESPQSTLPLKHNMSMSCQKLIQGDVDEINRTSILNTKDLHLQKDLHLHIGELRSCSNYFRSRRFINHSVRSELDFPIAYSILIFKDFNQFVSLLEAIWRPQNVYCVHVDGKSSNMFHAAVRRLTSCFTNVFVASRLVRVQWGTFTVLEPELVCMRDLWMVPTKWRYFINLTGQEFPLKTNYELVEILQAYNGTNDIFGTSSRANKGRWRRVLPAPHGITPMKGPVHVIASRDFVDYVLHSHVARDFLHWTNKTKYPDETFFPSLNNNRHLRVPGHYAGDPETRDRRFLGRYKIWKSYGLPCKGRYVRLICVLGVGDLAMLTKAAGLFANKFDSSFQPVAYECMREWYFQKVEREQHGNLEFDVSLYRRHAA